MRRIGILFYCFLQCGSLHAVFLPTGLTPADSYYLVFTTNSTYAATFSTIAEYDALVEAEATQVGSLVSDLTGWRVIGSTAYIDARDHLSDVTNGSFPIWDLASNKIADSGADLWDGSIDNPLTYNQFGVDMTGTGSQLAQTGTDTDGTAFGTNFFGNAADGAANVVRRGDITATDGTWISRDAGNRSGARRLYAISSLIVGVPEPAAYGLLAMSLTVCCVAFKRRREQKLHRSKIR